VTGAIVGTTPFMDSLLFLITLIFLVCGICYGMGAKSMSGSGDVIAGVTKTFAGLAGLVFMLLMISQFIAYFNYTNLPRVPRWRWRTSWSKPTSAVSLCWSDSSS
jgi:aminobenzoyl-glutamate transport protein